MYDMNTPLELVLKRPTGRLSGQIQAIWSAQANASVSRRLFGDACSGVMFNLGTPLTLESNTLGQGVYGLPVSRKANVVRFLPGSRVVGVRFLPGVGRARLGACFSEPHALSGADFPDWALLLQQLRHTRGHYQALVCVYRWLCSHTENPLPLALTQAISQIGERRMADIGEGTELGQRQLSRHFRHYLGLTPKQFQRVIRVKDAITALKASRQSLAEFALEHGFSDQAHMTREFHQLAGVTPNRVRVFESQTSAVPCADK